MDDYEYERKVRREREKSERQQVQASSSSNREVALFSEPRRVNPSEDDDDIAAKLGDYSKVKDFINLYTVGISNSGHRQMPPNAVLPGIVPTSPASSSLISPMSSSSSSSSRLQPPPPPQSQQPPPSHHYQQHQQQLRQAPYVKQADNKPPYNGRGGYPGQSVNRLSSGMAPPKGPPGSLLPPSSTHMPNGRQTSSSSSASEKSYLGPPSASSSTTHNGRFSQPSIPKQRQKPAFHTEENDIKEILNQVTTAFRPPKMLTGIDATPHNTLMENYNLNEPNKHKYSFDISEKTNSMIEPLDSSPPHNDMPAPRYVPPLSAAATQMPSTQSASNNLSSSSSSYSSSTTSSTYIAPPPAANASSASAINNMTSTSASTGLSLTSSSYSSMHNAAITSSPTVPLSPLMGRTKDTGFLKPFKSEKPTPPPIENRNNTLENDLELSESDDDRVKLSSHSAVNSSDSSQSDSSESGSESSKSETNQSIIPAATQHHLQQHQQQMSSSLASKKKIGPGCTASSGSSSSGLGSSAPPSGGSSSSSSNKTPSPNTTKWQLSRYFNKAPQHQTPTQDVVSPSAGSVANSVNPMNVAKIITLKGGAQIIPEQLTNIKNESMLDDDDEDDDDNGNDNVNKDIDRSSRRSRNKKDGGKNETFQHPDLAGATAAFPTRKTSSLLVTPLSPILTDIKKESSTSLGGTSSQQQVSDFLSMNSNQIKHETMVIAGGHTTVTPYDVLNPISTLSSDSNSNDEGSRERLPVRGPGGTLQIPGVPAAITALPRSPPIMQKAQMPNTVTMIPLGPLSSGSNGRGTAPIAPIPPTPTRAKKPRKKLKQQQNALLAPDTSDEESDNANKQRLTSPPSGAVAKTMTTPGGTKKGRGRPRKTATPSSGNSSTTAATGPPVVVVTATKGPTLTAKKDINKKPPPTAPTTTPTSKDSATATARRRMSRLSSTNSLALQEAMAVPPITTTPIKQQLPTTSPVALKATPPPPVIVKTQIKETALKTSTSDDSSSSSDSSSFSNSKSSCSSSDSEIEEPSKKPTQSDAYPSLTSDDDDDENTATKALQKPGDLTSTKAVTAAVPSSAHPKRIVKKLNTRKSSLEDLSTASSTKLNNICLSSPSSSSSESSAEDFLPPAIFANQQTAAGTTAATQSIGAAAVASNGAAGTGSGGSSQRSVNQQSPYKVSSALSNRSRKQTPCSSAFSSESSAEDNSDSDLGVARKEKKLKRDKPKSDKNKISTLTRIFKTSNEGGAKKQGQVLIVDQSEEQQQQQQIQKHISPALRGSQENLAAAAGHTPTAQSPRLTPGGQLRSPRSLPPLATQVLTAGCLMGTASHRTPDRVPFDRVTTSAERKLQQRIKTPTRTPTRTPPTTRTPTPTPPIGAAAVNASSITTNPTPSASPATAAAGTAGIVPPPSSSRLPTSLICKIDLSRLLPIPAEWHSNTYRLYGRDAATNSQPYLTPASAGRTPIYDHETILNADMHSCNTQMRLKSGGSGSVTPRSTGNRTPLQAGASITAERELSHSRESLHDIAKDMGVINPGRLSSRSTDGSICGGGSTPKDLGSHLLPPGPPNGYSSVTAIARGYASPSNCGGKLGPIVKHEQIIKHEPDAMDYSETKFKADAASTDPAVIKQELLMLKQDFKPSDLDKMSEKSSTICSPNTTDTMQQLLEAKPKRKRSSSSSSSPYKEKKRKKEKERDRDKDKEKEKDNKDKDANANAAVTNMFGSVGAGVNEKDKKLMTNDAGDVLEKAKDVMIDSLKPATKDTLDAERIDNSTQMQFPPTNHERLESEKSHPQLQVEKPEQQSDKSYGNNIDKSSMDHNALPENTSTTVTNTASPAHLQISNLTTMATSSLTTTSIMPPPANVGLNTTHPTAEPAVSGTSNAKAMSASDSNTTTPTMVSSTTPDGNIDPPSTATTPKVIYRSYFERDEEALHDEFSITKEGTFLQEAIQRKHAADREQNILNQVALYLEAVVYFLLSGAAMEQQSRTEDPAWTMYKDTLVLIKYITTKFRQLQQVSSADQTSTLNKYAVLSLRCQSLISLKLFKLKRISFRQVNTICMDFLKSGKGDIINGNTSSSMSPSNSVCSQGSGSNTPPGKIVPQDIHSALQQQNQYFHYLANSHELWEQADRLVKQNNLTDFFIALDHKNGPLTLHSSVYEVFRYVQAGLKKLKWNAYTIITTTTTTRTANYVKSQQQLQHNLLYNTQIFCVAVKTNS
uniref:AF4/FMR2 family member lilli n=1 Tax=Musca domestica TaxID=7370 RepID=A0A1I8MX19_MUSDO